MTLLPKSPELTKNIEKESLTTEKHRHFFTVHYRKTQIQIALLQKNFLSLTEDEKKFKLTLRLFFFFIEIKYVIFLNLWKK